MGVRVDRVRRRVYLGRLRIHHGLVGAVLLLAGAWLCGHDRRDFPWLPLPDAD